MKLFTILTSALLAVSVLLSSCQTPPATKFDRQLTSWKARTGGASPDLSRHRH